MSQERKTFRLQVMSVNGVFFDDRASEIILPCIDGEFAILANHEEMVLAIYNGKMTIRDAIGDRIDAVVGIVKGVVFGGIITSLGCYYGYYTEGGADGVGKATTNAVVYSSILILIFNYILTDMFF